jgi:hypothetical protein
MAASEPVMGTHVPCSGIAMFIAGSNTTVVGVSGYGQGVDRASGGNTKVAQIHFEHTDALVGDGLKKQWC